MRTRPPSQGDPSFPEPVLRCVRLGLASQKTLSSCTYQPVMLLAGMNFSGISDRTLVGRLLRAPLALLPTGMRMPVLQGPLRGKTWIVGAHTHGCWLGSYELDKQRLFARSVKAGAVIYDVGANAGFYSMLGSVLTGPTGRVIAFEPSPRNLAFLREHVRLNALGNVSILDLAVAEQPGTASFKSGSSGATGSLAVGGDLEVRTSSLDSLVESRVIPPPNLIKMDIEGGELAAIRGARKVLRQHRPMLLLATHGAEVHRACVTELQALDYELSSLNGQSILETDELLATPRVAQ